MRRYNPKEIEPKWQKIWAESGIYKASDPPAGGKSRPKRYVLEYFPYPSGSAMHVGHVRNYTIGDTMSRFMRMQGNNVLHPMGWDAFGLPAENYAIKTGISPQAAVAKNVKHFKKQLMQMGFSYDWSREINSTDPSYYRWTQWLFLLLFRKGLAYQKEALVNWDPEEKTVLANEQVIDGRGERSGALVEKKSLKQWFFKITDHADRLDEDLENLDWSPAIKAMQHNWIGKSTGAEIEFRINAGSNDRVISYLMGVDDIKDDLEKIGIQIESQSESGSYKVSFPKNKAPAFEALVKDRLKPGFWNEYISDDVVFIFKDKSGKTQRIVWNESNELELLGLCRDYAKSNFPSIREMLEGNDWYSGKLPEAIRVFTTRPDTIFGATFIVLAPEHDLLNKLSIPNKAKVNQYIKETGRKSEVERQETGREKTGVFTGIYAVNPANKEKIPVWVADYVLPGYGTGAIMAVPAHDDRDWGFAMKFNLPIQQVVAELLSGVGEVEFRPGEKIVERNVAQCIVWHPTQEKVIVLEVPAYKWRTLVMGGIDEGEDWVDGAKREIHEETGYKNLEFIGYAGQELWSEFWALHKSENRIAHFRGMQFKLKDLERDEIAGDEADKHMIHWLKPEDAISKFKIPEPKYFLESALAGNEFKPYTGEGKLVNSGAYNSMATAEARDKMAAQFGEPKTNYRLRDWLISRQRYWGAPIPIIHCPKCGPVAVPEKDLPVVLPEVKSYEPSGDGRSPLANVPDFVNVDCPKCGGKAERETDTMDGFACSSWYFLRFADPHNDKAVFDKDKADFWLPVDDYIGGAEHAVMHLLYARFWTKVMFDDGLINFDEPFSSLRNHGMILAPDGSKMSKSKGNTIEPDELLSQGYGADSIRLMELFIGPWNQAVNWSVDGLGGTFRFLQRYWTLTGEFLESASSSNQKDLEITAATHKTIKKVSQDLRRMDFNTALAAMMGLVNELYKIKAEQPISQSDGWRFGLESLTQLLSPFAPHITEELWQSLGHDSSVHISAWPEWDEKLVAEQVVTIAVQVNGKVRAEIVVATDISEAEALEAAKSDDRVAAHIKDKPLKKAIYVPSRLVSLVV